MFARHRLLTTRFTFDYLYYMTASLPIYKGYNVLYRVTSLNA
jgi:hypothetical protein